MIIVLFSVQLGWLLAGGGESIGADFTDWTRKFDWRGTKCCPARLGSGAQLASTAASLRTLPGTAPRR
ncbi:MULTISPECIES: hypothetical protein [unclassified Variovorax]|uniref:hypothetical protein n=1 Tax=unclassified Variovorax TaxID=663243 RepID=UPI00116068B8|nr:MULTISPECIES: hypothetical protein [unclassified Variovorax]